MFHHNALHANTRPSRRHTDTQKRKQTYAHYTPTDMHLHVCRFYHCACVCVCPSGSVSPQLAIVLRIPLVLVSAHCLNIEYTDYCWLLLVVCVCECVFICLVVTADTSYVIGLWSGKQDTADQVQ